MITQRGDCCKENTLEAAGSEGERLIGRGKSDTLQGGDGGDSLFGANGFDHLSGGAGNDTLEGGNGRDTLYGGEGNDTIDGGNGTDFLFGKDLNADPANQSGASGFANDQNVFIGGVGSGFDFIFDFDISDDSEVPGTPAETSFDALELNGVSVDSGGNFSVGGSGSQRFDTISEIQALADAIESDGDPTTDAFELDINKDGLDDLVFIWTRKDGSNSAPVDGVVLFGVGEEIDTKEDDGGNGFDNIEFINDLLLFFSGEKGSESDMEIL